MKTLIVTTGTKDYILNIYLPTLKNKGKYNGNILLVNYGDFKEEDIKQLQKSNILVFSTKKVYPCIPSDRIRAFYECLRENNLYREYDVIMITDGNDVEYFEPIAPLFELAKNIFSCCIETPEHLVRGWIRFKEYPNADAVWEIIKDKPMINAGLMIGPAEDVFKAIEFITDQTKYNSKFGADQMLLNALVYYYKIIPTQIIDNKWNYVLLTSHRRMAVPRQGKMYAIEDGREIAILHRNGPKHMDYATWRKFVFPACKMPNEGWMKKINEKEITEKIEDTRVSISGKKDWGGAAQTNPELRLISLLVRKVSKLEGDIAEVGVFKGGSAKFICNYKEGKTIHLFDTFEGLPEIGRDDYIEPYGRHKTKRLLAKGEMIGTLEEVKKNLASFSNVYCYKGLFPNTAEPIKNINFSFVHLDVDIYKSTIDALKFFYFRMVKGGIILIHDYHMCTGVKRALDEFLMDKPETLIVEGNQCYIVKEEIININIEDLAIYPYFNEEIHLEVYPIKWYNTEYIKMRNYDLELIKDIKDNGIKECLLVYKLFDGKYGVVDGNHRYYVALRNNIKVLPCKILSSEEIIEIMDKIRSRGITNLIDFRSYNWYYIKNDTINIDQRILEVNNYYNIKDKRVLELGTFEARDTYTLEYMQPREIVSIEGRLRNYMKANLVRFMFKMDKTTLLFRDIDQLNFEDLGHFDFILARGIIHYLLNPVEIIKRLSKISNNLWLGIRLINDSIKEDDVYLDGYYVRKIYNKETPLIGLHEYSLWFFREELLRLLRDLGYDIIIVREPTLENINYVELYARK